MATSSIFRNIVLDDPVAAEKFVLAMEKAATNATKWTPCDFEAEDMSDEDLRRFMEQFQ